MPLKQFLDRIDRRSRTPSSPPASSRTSCPQTFSQHAVPDPDPGPGQLHCERDQVRGSLWQGPSSSHECDRSEGPMEGEPLMPLPAKLRAPGWYRAALFDVLGFGFAFGLTVLIRWLMHEHPVVDGNAITIVVADRRAAVLPRRPRRVRLLVLLGVGQADAPRGPLRPRRAHAGRTTSASTPTTR